MGADQHHGWQALAASALEWWHDAGVDTLVDEEPRDWLARPTAALATTTPDPIVQDVPVLPATLAEFLPWRAGADAPEAGWGSALTPAEGDPASDVMVIVDMPTGATLLERAPGLLFDRMLAAIGRDRTSIYLASLALACPLGGRIPPESEAKLATLLRHHVMLARPRRLLLLGQAPSRAIIGMDVAQDAETLHAVNLNTVTTDAVVSFHPRFLLERPAMKAQAWKDLQMLMRGLR